MDAAELAGIVGAIGAVAALLASGRRVLLAGLALLAGAEVGLVLSVAGGNGVSPALLALGAAGLVPLAAGAAVLVRWPALVLPAVLAAAPFRPPLAFSSENDYFVAVAAEGELGRLLPLYGVLGAAALALAWHALRGRGEPAALPLIVSLPAAVFIAVAAVSLTWTSNLDAGANTLAYFLFPFATLLAAAGRAPFPPWMPRALAAIGVALAVLFAAVGLWQAATRELLFFSPSVEVGNAFSSFFRVTSLFRDPSLYGRHVVLGIAVLLVVLLCRRLHVAVAAALIAVLFAGLFFSYSQSSFAALFVVTIALGLFAGDRRLRLVALVVSAVVLLAGAAYFVASSDDRSAREVTSDRSRRVEATVEVIRDHPVVGVGLGAQPAESQARSEQGGSPTRFVSHTTPLTVAAELGLLGLVAYLAFLAGAAVLIQRVWRRDPTLGLALGAVLLALVVHSLAYSGFFEDPITWVVVAVASAALAILEPAG
jgi:putative inorganic carbon (HCO3(-)) transporter